MINLGKLQYFTFSKVQAIYFGIIHPIHSPSSMGQPVVDYPGLEAGARGLRHLPGGIHQSWRQRGASGAALGQLGVHGAQGQQRLELLRLADGSDGVGKVGRTRISGNFWAEVGNDMK